MPDRFCRVALFTLLLSCCALHGQAARYQQSSPAQLFEAQDIFRIASVTDAQISPDGQQIVYQQNAADIKTDRMISSLWLIPTAGGTPRRLVEGAAYDPRWSPDSTQVAYLAPDAQGNTLIHLTMPATGNDVIVTHGDMEPGDIAWSPNGQMLAFTSFVALPVPTLAAPLEKPKDANWASALRFYDSKHYLADGAGFTSPGYTHLFVVPANAGEPRQVTFGETNDAAPVWSPDGATLLYSSESPNAHIVDFGLRRVWQVGVTSGEKRRLSPDPLDASQIAVAPDGKHIAFIGYSAKHPGDFVTIGLFVMDRNGSNLHQLGTSLDRIPNAPAWTADSQALMICFADHGAYRIAQVGLNGSFKDLATDAVGSFSASRNGVLAFPLGSADHPDDLATADGRQQHRLTDLNGPWIRDRALGKLKPFTVRSSLDGTPLGAWALLPPGFVPGRHYPTILEIHGGPYGEDTPYWRTGSQLFAAAGYVVLFANYRGSTSYGMKFSQAIDRDFPGPAYDDLMSVVDAAVREGMTDPSRLFVTGGSAGGELTAWITGKTSRFRAAAAVKPVVDVLNMVLENDQYLYAATTLFATTPWQSPLTFWNHSPLSLVDNMSTPTLVMVGEEDRRTPLDQSLQLYNALQIRGVPCGLVIVPDAGHEGLSSRPSQRAEEDLAILAWFARYGGPPEGSHALHKP